MGLVSPKIQAGLYVVATPIGTASDISLRALDLLINANVLVAEDKRVLRKLMRIHGIKLKGRIIISYNDHSNSDKRAKIIQMLREKKSVVFTSDAGTPLIADPGYRLVFEAISNNLHVTGAPGPSAVLAGLMISGLPTDKFFFGGFIPTKKEAKRQFFMTHLDLPATLIFYESALRLVKTLNDLCVLCDNERQVVVCRELTKKFEDVQRGTLREISKYYASAGKVKGEIVLLLSPFEPKVVSEKYIQEFLIDTLEYMSSKDALSFVSRRLNIPKKIVYDQVLKIKYKSL